MPPHLATRTRWTVIIPVKRTTLAKTRLSSYDSRLRQRFALAFACDTVAAALACSDVERVVVVTNDTGATLFRRLGADVVSDRPDAGINPALAHGAEHIRRDHPRACLAAVAADLPALTPDALGLALGSTVVPAFFVPDALGNGTTLVAAAQNAPWRSAFGADSRAAHRAQGLHEIGGAGLETLRRDVDTELDLADARRLGLGVHTRHVLASPQCAS